MKAEAPATMSSDRKAEFLEILSGTQADLGQLGRSSDTEVNSVARAFKSLADQADMILQQAATIVGYVEQARASTGLSNVQALCMTVGTIMGQRLDAASSILEALQDEEKLLRQLILVTQKQETISTNLRTLSVLTNIEIANLGSVGGGFHLLAQELSAFSSSLAEQTQELATDTKSRQQAIAETRKEMAASVPSLRNEVTQMASDTNKALGTIDADLSQQAKIPGQFRRCAEETARQIAGVVTGLQGHDITRQQLEHVARALQLIASKIETADTSGDTEFPTAYAALNVQVCQLKVIRKTLDNWTTQVRRCMDGIQQLSASEVVGIGPAVLQQEQELSGELTRIQQLQQRSHQCSARMQDTLSGLSNLVELADVQLKRSAQIRDDLQTLMFNSLIESQRLGKRGAAVSVIANLIRELSDKWNAIADQSRVALSGILELVQRTTALMEAFSEASDKKLNEEEAQTRLTLESVRATAALVSTAANQMQAVTENMHLNSAEVATSGDRLDVCIGQLDAALSQIEGMARQWEKDGPELAEQYDAAQVEEWLSGFYTTEIERSVMRAFLNGTALPAPPQSFTGNAVELF